MAQNLRAILRMAEGHSRQPGATIFDNRTLHSAPESEAWVGDDGAKRRNSNKVHLAVDTPGHLLSLHVSTPTEQDHAHVAQLAVEAQAVVTEENVESTLADQGYTGEATAAGAEARGIVLDMVKLPEAK